MIYYKKNTLKIAFVFLLFTILGLSSFSDVAEKTDKKRYSVIMEDKEDMERTAMLQVVFCIS